MGGKSEKPAPPKPKPTIKELTK